MNDLGNIKISKTLLIYGSIILVISYIFFLVLGIKYFSSENIIGVQDDSEQTVGTTSVEVIDKDEENNISSIFKNITSVISKSSKKENENVVDQKILNPTTLKETMAWVYPGEPSCDALDHVIGQNIDILKPEYFLVSENGDLVFLTEELYGCNGYSTENIKSIRSVSGRQYVTVSSSYSKSMNLFLNYDKNTAKYTDTLVDFVIKEDFEGIEIDFEDFGGWTSEDYSLYKEFLNRLGSKLHSSGKKLMVDIPPVKDEIEESWYQFRLSDLENLPVDHIVIMMYDYQFDHGIGQPVSPPNWIEEVINFTISRYPYNEKITVGLPLYGYKGNKTNRRFEILTYDQISKMNGFDSAVRDNYSYEMMWNNGNIYYVYQDSKSIQKKIETVLDSNIGSISFWHLGGNPPYK